MKTTLLEKNEKYIKTEAENRNGAYTALTEKCKEIAERLENNWLANGGCKRCNGYEVVLTWCTMDGASYDEHGSCPDCTPSSRDAGTNPRHQSASSSNGSNRRGDVNVARKYASEETDELYTRYHELKYAYDMTPKKEHIRRGSIVIVTKGRKVPVGTYGIVVGTKTWSPRNYYGTTTSIGILTPDGSVVWGYLDNVEILHVLPNKEREQLENALEESRKQYLGKREVA